MRRRSENPVFGGARVRECRTPLKTFFAVLPSALRSGGFSTSTGNQGDPRWQRDQWTARNGEAARVFKCVLALRDMIDDVTKDAVSRLGTLERAPGSADTIANRRGELRFKMVPLGQELAAAKILLEAGENSPQFKLAEAEYAPLLKSAAERDASEGKLRQDRQRAELALVQAQESAKAAALKAAETDPIIMRAARDLADAEKAVSEL
jgi:hypothetical protein